MKRFIHIGYFREAFKQLRTPGIVTACVLMLFNLVTLFTNITNLVSQRLPSVPNEATMAMQMMAFIYIAGLILTFIGFNWLNKRSTSDFYHALPIKRSAIYWSTVLAISLWLCIGITAYALVYAGMFLLMGLPFNYLSFLCVYGNMLIGILHVVGVISLACALSGTRFVNLFSAAAILLMPRALLLILAGLISEQAPYLPVLRISFLFDPSFNLFGAPYMVLAESLGMNALRFTDGWAMLYSLTHAALIAFAGCIAFIRRPSEAAGMPMRNRFLQGVIRTAFGLPLLLVIVLMVVEEEFSLSLFVILAVFAFTFYCLYELISTKSAKRMLKSMPLFTVCIAIAGLYLIVPKLVQKTTASVVADSDNIISFELIEKQTSYRDILENRVTIDDPSGIRIIANAYRRTVNAPNGRDGTDCTVRIHRKNGWNIVRNLQITSAESTALHALIHRDETYSAKEKAFPEGISYFGAPSLTFSKAGEVGRIFAEEYNALSDADRALANQGTGNWGESESDFCRSYYVLSVRGTLGVHSYSERYAITDLTPKAAQRYAELLYRKDAKQVKEKIEKCIAWMETGEGIRGNILIGSNLTVNLYENAWSYANASGLPKWTDPEYYEILQILKDAEPTQNANEGATVAFGTYYNADYDYLTDGTFLSSTIGSPSPDCVFLKLTDAQLVRIRALLKEHTRRIDECVMAQKYGD